MTVDTVRWPEVQEVQIGTRWIRVTTFKPIAGLSWTIIEQIATPTS